MFLWRGYPWLKSYSHSFSSFEPKWFEDCELSTKFRSETRGDMKNIIACVKHQNDPIWLKMSFMLLYRALQRKMNQIRSFWCLTHAIIFFISPLVSVLNFVESSQSSNHLRSKLEELWQYNCRILWLQVAKLFVAYHKKAVKPFIKAQ